MSANMHAATHYRLKAEKCREAAARAKDSASRLYWEQAQRCWLTLANEAEVTHATAMDYLDGKTDPFTSTRRKLAKALGLPFEQLPT